jgi:dTDP-4-amino-4,6-dideoxygalactose transaminase
MAPDVSDFILPVLHSGYIGEGPKSRELEKWFGEYIGNHNCVIVNSGTSAITLALKLAGVGPGDKVLSTPMTCLASNTSILNVGATPVWADIMMDGTIDPREVGKILSKQKVKAMMCMDWGGKPCMLDELMALSVKYGVPLIEDACQAIGAEYKGVKVGNQATYVAFSTQAIKHLTTVDGGFLCINGHQMWAKSQCEDARMMRWFGLDRDKGADMRCNQDPPVVGYKWQMNDVLASIGLANSRGLEQRIEKSRLNAQRLNKCFGLSELAHRKSSYWLYTVIIEEPDRFIQYMKLNGVECSRVHDRNDTKTIFRDSKTPLPGVDWFDEFHVCIPCGWWVTEQETNYICELIDRWFNEDFQTKARG